jgi:hypothetical protein
MTSTEPHFKTGESIMPSTNRREFLQQAAAGVAGAAAVQFASEAHAAAESERLVVGLIGCGGRGMSLLEYLRKLPNVELAYLADVDENRLSGAMRNPLAMGAKPVKDFREVLDDKSVNGVIVATPDHWHAPAAILACDAGKHVYVEKPCSHNIREGRLLVEAARRNDRVVQRHTPQHQHDDRGGVNLRDGVIGDVLMSKARNIQHRSSIGKQLSDPPPNSTRPGAGRRDDSVSGNAFISWHWWFTGTGDAATTAFTTSTTRWGLGVETHPSRIMGPGGNYFFDDDQEF